MYKRASRIKLRVKAPQGLLTVEQLWDLPLNTLDKIAVSLQEQYKKSGSKSFLVRKSPKNKELKLAFDIVLDILADKVEEANLATKTAADKAHNQKILAAIDTAENRDLANKSPEELRKMLK